MSELMKGTAEQNYIDWAGVRGARLSDKIGDVITEARLIIAHQSRQKLDAFQSERHLRFETKDFEMLCKLVKALLALRVKALDMVHLDIDEE